MKKRVMIALVVLVALAGAAYTVGSCKLIGTGKVGVQYSYKGGVKDETLNPGLNFINPFLKVKEFTVGNEQLILTKDKRKAGRLCREIQGKVRQGKGKRRKWRN